MSKSSSASRSRYDASDCRQYRPRTVAVPLGATFVEGSGVDDRHVRRQPRRVAERPPPSLVDLLDVGVAGAGEHGPRVRRGDRERMDRLEVRLVEAGPGTPRLVRLERRPHVDLLVRRVDRPVHGGRQARLDVAPTRRRGRCRRRGRPARSARRPPRPPEARRRSGWPARPRPHSRRRWPLPAYGRRRSPSRRRGRRRPRQGRSGRATGRSGRPPGGRRALAPRHGSGCAGRPRARPSSVGGGWLETDRTSCLPRTTGRCSTGGTPQTPVDCDSPGRAAGQEHPPPRHRLAT